MIAALAGCGGGGDDDDEVAETPTGFVRVVNAVPDSPVLTAQLDEALLANISFGQASALEERATGAVSLDVQFSDPGGTTEEIVDDLNLTVDADEEVTVVVSGPLEAPLTTAIENPLPNLASSEAEVHFFHAVTGAERLDFYLEPSDATVLDNSPEASLGFGESSPTMTAASGEYRILVTAEGGGDVVYDSGPFSLAALTRRLMVAVDYFGPGTTAFRVVRVDPSSASNFPAEQLPTALRTINLVADVPTIDVTVDDALTVPVFTSVGFGTLTEYLEFEPGATTITATMAGDPSAVLASEQVQLIAGEQRTLAVAGTQFDSSSAARLVLDEVRRVATETKLQVVHGSRSAGSVDFYLLSPGQPTSDSEPRFNSLSFLTNGILSVEPGTFDLVFTPVGETASLFGPQRVSMVANGIYTIFLSDADGGGTPLRLILADDFVD